MATSVTQMMEAPNAAVRRITPAEAKEMIARGNALVVDVRDAPEMQSTGKVAGAMHVSRGMLEFRADPESPYGHFVLRVRRPLGALGQSAEGYGLRASL